jgi:hypothetical protein
MNPYRVCRCHSRWTAIPILLVVLILASLLASCGVPSLSGPTPTAVIWVATATLPPHPVIRVETATFTPTQPTGPVEGAPQEVEPCPLITHQ